MASKKYVYPYRETFEFEGQIIDVKARTTRELIEKVNAKKAALKSNIIDSDITVSKWADQWLTKYKINSVGAAWYGMIKGIVVNKITPVIGHLPIKNVLPIHIQDVLAGCTYHSNSYITKIYNILSEMFESAKTNRLIERNPVDGLKKPKGKKNQKRRAVTDNERKYILSVCDKYEKPKLFVYLMLYAGLRPQEIAVLQWRNIDLKHRSIKIEQALKRDGTVGEPKSDAGKRKVPIPSVLLDELIKNRTGPFNYVCTQTCGERHTHTSIRQMWESFERRLNVEMGCKTYRGKVVPPYRVAEDLTPYCLRHTYCTDLQAAGIAINVAREYMGHSDIRTTSEIYTHESEITFANAIAMLDGLEAVENSMENNPQSIVK